MPGKRDPSQTIMSVSLSRKLLSVVDSARVKKLRGVNRAQFIRDALAEKLSRMGIDVPLEDIIAPDRAMVHEEPEEYKVTKPTKKRKS
jgi:hypothetical protein